MKTALALLLIGSQAFATTADVFKSVSFTQPKCYGSKDSKATVKATLMKYSADTTIDSNGLKIEVRFAKEPKVKYHAEMSCFDNEGKTLCAIECDGGSVVVAAIDEGHLKLTNNGFLIRGGCGSEEKTKYLKTPQFDLKAIRCQ